MCARVPNETKLYCGHEYTLANIGFAKTVEPDNAALKQREARDQALRPEGKPTLPSTLGEEKTPPSLPGAASSRGVESANKLPRSAHSRSVRVFAAYGTGKNRF